MESDHAGGVQVAAYIDALHGENNLTNETQLDEHGRLVNGRSAVLGHHDRTDSMP